MAHSEPWGVVPSVVLRAVCLIVARTSTALVFDRRRSHVSDPSNFKCPSWKHSSVTPAIPAPPTLHNLYAYPPLGENNSMLRYNELSSNLIWNKTQPTSVFGSRLPYDLCSAAPIPYCDSCVVKKPSSSMISGIISVGVGTAVIARVILEMIVHNQTSI